MSIYKHSNKQHGAALVISLLIMLVMTMLGLSMLNSTTMEVKMASNNQQRQIAYQAAETALRAAETVLAALSTEPQLSSFDGTNELYNSFSGTPADFDDATTWTTAKSKDVDIADLDTDPRYVIEYLGRAGRVPVDPNAPDTRPHAFKITAIGFGVDTAARYLLSSSFSKHLN